MVEPRTRSSVLGSLALLAGIAALLLDWFNFTDLPVLTIGQIHLRMPLVVGAAGLLLALLSVAATACSRRTGTGIPLAAMVICGAAAGMGIYAMRPRSPAVPAAPKAIPAPVGPAAKTQLPGKVPKSSVQPAKASRPASMPAADTIGPSADQRALLRTARAKLDAARADVIRSLESTGAYQSAAAAADEAENTLRRDRATYPSGSAQLTSAAQSALDAHNKLEHLIEDAMSRDPASIQARNQLDAVEAQGKH